jgi:hypothetical protein
MTAAPSWTILVPTLGERGALFQRLMAGLLPQAERHPGVQVVGWWNNGSPSLPKIRQTMVATATTEYVSFVDDDDLVSPDYVDEIVAAMASRPDYVGFTVQCYSDGWPTAMAHHALKYGRWANLKTHYERDISHINPMRAALARKADFTRAKAGRAEDRIWVDQLRRSGALRTEVVIPKVLYHYLYSTNRTAGFGSRWERPSSIRSHSDLVRPEITSPAFSWSAHA